MLFIFLEVLQRASLRYALAVKQAAAAFGLATAKNPIFVEWVVDPEKVRLGPTPSDSVRLRPRCSLLAFGRSSSVPRLESYRTYSLEMSRGSHAMNPYESLLMEHWFNMVQFTKEKDWVCRKQLLQFGAAPDLQVEMNYWMLGNGILIGSCLISLVISALVILGQAWLKLETHVILARWMFR